MNKKMRIVSMICAAAILTGCSGYNVNIVDEITVSSEAPVAAAVNMSAKSAVSKPAADDINLYIPNDEICDNMVNNIISEYAYEYSEINVMSDENAAKLEKALQNIRINNSRFALPMMIKDLPKEFSIKINQDEKEEIGGKFSLYMGTLFMGDERYTDALIILKDGADEKYGIIVGMSAYSEMCKWSFGDIEFSYDNDKIIQCFGDPSSYSNHSDLLGALGYVTPNNDYVEFLIGLNGIMCFSFNMENITENGLLAEYAPYDDFDGIPEIPELTGEPREIDWNRIFDEDCIVIGNEKYPSLARIGDLGDDINIIEYSTGRDFSQDGNYLRDTYTIMYKGRTIGNIYAMRQSGEPLDDALIYSWSLTLDQIPFPTAIMDIPLSQDFDEISKIYTPNAQNEKFYKYLKIAETDEEKYMCTFALMYPLAIWNVTPVSASPELYEKFLEQYQRYENMNEQ